MEQKVIDKHNSVRDFETIIIPILKANKLTHIIPQLLYRIEWFRNHSNFTVRISDRDKSDVPNIETLIRRIWHGSKEDAPILQAYINKIGQGPVLSFGIIMAQDLARIVSQNTLCYEKTHPTERTLFRCVMFSKMKELNLKKYAYCGEIR